MGDPPLVPPSPPSPHGGNGQDGNDFLNKPLLDQLKKCGVNETHLTKFGGNQTVNHLLLNQIFSLYNCSSINNGPPTESTSSNPHILLVVYFVTIMVLGLAVNICVIGTICRVRKLRTITNCFVLSLALADLLMAAVVVPLKIKESETSQLLVLDTLFPILGVASLLNLCAVTLDRYFTITNPLTYEAKVSGLHTGIAIALIWIFSTSQEMIAFAVAKDEAYLFQVIRFVIVFSVPFICVIFVNAKIYLIARGHARQINASVPDQNDSNRRNFSRKVKTARVIGLLVGTFMLTWLPYFVITIYEQIHEQRLKTQSLKMSSGVQYKQSIALEIGKIVCAALACSTALFNPLLYGFLRKEVRNAIVKSLSCQNVNQLDFNASTEITTRRIENTRK